MRAVRLTLCPEDILADLVGLPNELFEAQLSEEGKGNCNHGMDCT
jgi:hypothetical protein